jgi:hypothetical protein
MLELPVRVERVRLLLATLDNPYPRPHGALQADSGPSASRYVPCETCRASGSVHRRGGWVMCLVCDGAGEKRRTDEPPWDAYVRMPLDVAVGLPTAPPARPLAPGLEESTYGWERARAAYDRHGSYRELRRRLAWLAEENPRRYRLVRTVLVDGNDVDLGARAERELALGVLMIAMRMRSVRVPRWLLEREHANERTETIRDLAAAGMAAGEIAKRTGASKRATRRKLRRIALGSGGAGTP